MAQLICSLCTKYMFENFLLGFKNAFNIEKLGGGG